MFSLRERLIASEIWPRTWVLVLLAFAVGSVMADIDFSLSAPRSPFFVMPLLLAISVTVLLTLIISPFAAYFLFSSIVDRQIRRNGGPFAIGDRVAIIPGRNSGRTATVTSFGQFRSLRITIDGGDVEIDGYGHHHLKRIG